MPEVANLTSVRLDIENVPLAVVAHLQVSYECWLYKLKKASPKKGVGSLEWNDVLH